MFYRAFRTPGIPKMDKPENCDTLLSLDDFIFEEASTLAHAPNEHARKQCKPRKRRKAKPKRAVFSKEDFHMEKKIISSLEISGYTVSDPCAVYDLDKAKAGLLLSEVRRIDRIGAWAVRHMGNPMGFHLEIYPNVPDATLVKELNKLPKWLDRAGEQYGTEGTSHRVLFVYKVEWSRDGRAHIHLYCVVDSWDKHRIERLKRLLAERLSCEVKLIPRKAIYDGNVYMVLEGETREVLKYGRTRRIPLWHFLKGDFEDWRRRTTYAAKNHTRKDIGTFQSFHCSRVSL